MAARRGLSMVYEVGQKGGLMIKRLDPRKDNGA